MSNQWIKCSDELPDDEITVITFVADSNEPVWLGYHCDDCWYTESGLPMLFSVVTHWMPFPNPPEI